MRHVAILKAKQGELKALHNADAHTADNLLPLFEISRIPAEEKWNKGVRESSTPVLTYLDQVLEKVGACWTSRSAMVDGYHWSPSAKTETGNHVIAHMVAKLKSMNVNAVPVVGYDRWSDEDYKLGIKGAVSADGSQWCLRLDNSAIDDIAEPAHFESIIVDILDELALSPEGCLALIDFADVSMGIASVEKMVAKASSIIEHLSNLGFSTYSVAGCSLPRTIDLAVSQKDTFGLVLRKEMLVWQSLAIQFPKLKIISGDYGIRGPTTTDIQSQYTNGKIRYTTKKQTFVVRGHPFKTDGSFAQMYGLAFRIISSAHYLGEDFSWGDKQIDYCSMQTMALTPNRPGNLSHWIAVDTNHHLTFAVQEVEEFERELLTSLKDSPGI